MAQSGMHKGTYQGMYHILQQAEADLEAFEVMQEAEQFLHELYYVAPTEEELRKIAEKLEKSFVDFKRHLFFSIEDMDTNGYLDNVLLWCGRLWDKPDYEDHKARLTEKELERVMLFWLLENKIAPPPTKKPLARY